MTKQSHKRVYMPKETFFNLPKEKRENILNRAIEEFATHSYSSASISKIVRDAKISKGSLYQYFEDKKDLYLYLIQTFMDEKRRYFESLDPPDDDLDLFSYLRWMARTSSEFRHRQAASRRCDHRRRARRRRP